MIDASASTDHRWNASRLTGRRTVAGMISLLLFPFLPTALGQAEKDPAWVVREFFSACLHKDQSRIKRYILPHPESHVLWTLFKPSPEELQEETTLLEKATFRIPKPGEKIVDMLTGNELVVGHEHIGQARSLVVVNAAEITMIFPVVKLEDSWRVDAGELIRQYKQNAIFDPQNYKELKRKLEKAKKENKPLLIQPGIGIGLIKLDMTSEELINAMGKPVYKYGKLFSYILLGMDVILGKDRRVEHISAGDSWCSDLLKDVFKGMTDKGVGMKSTKREIITAYGEPASYSDDSGVEMLYYKNLGMTFHLRNGKVTNVYLSRTVKDE